MTTPATPVRLTARGPEDLLALVPVVLGFVPSASVVMLTFAPGHGFHARLDLPPPGEPLEEWIEMLLAPARHHGVDRVAFVAYTGDAAHALEVLGALVTRFTGSGIDVVEALRADGRRWWFVLEPGDPGGHRYDAGAHPFAAHAVLEGVVVHASREALAATLAPLPERLPTGPAAAAGAAWVRATTSRLAAARDRPDDRLAVRLLRAVTDDPDARQAAWLHVPRASAPAHVDLWTGLVQRAPDELAAAAAGVLAFVAWLAGHGALAWCAVDRCRALSPADELAAMVADLLEAAVSPRTWDEGVVSGPGD